MPRPALSALSRASSLRTALPRRVAASQFTFRQLFVAPARKTPFIRHGATLPAFFTARNPLLRHGALLRHVSTSRITTEFSKPSRPIIRFLFRTVFYLGVVVGGVGIFIVGFFIYDASTYRETPGTEPVHTSSLALSPRRGGPKNLPIVEHFIDDDDCEHKKAQKHKPKLLILGTGWGSVALIKNLISEEYHVTVVSPSNQFLFTPMLPSATVGTLELRSLVEPIRRIVSRVHGHFLKAMAVDVAFSEKLVEVESVDAAGVKHSFYVPYDKLVIACGNSIPLHFLFITKLYRLGDEPTRCAWS